MEYLDETTQRHAIRRLDVPRARATKRITHDQKSSTKEFTRSSKSSQQEEATATPPIVSQSSCQQKQNSSGQEQSVSSPRSEQSVLVVGADDVVCLGARQLVLREVQVDLVAVKVGVVRRAVGVVHADRLLALEDARLDDGAGCRTMVESVESGQGLRLRLTSKQTETSAYEVGHDGRLVQRRLTVGQQSILSQKTRAGHVSKHRASRANR